MIASNRSDCGRECSRPISENGAVLNRERSVTPIVRLCTIGDVGAVVLSN